MRSVGTLIFERPRPLSRQRRANHLYTLICEEPVILTDVTNDMRVAREEIFGPVLVVIRYDNDDDAVRIANESE